MPMHAKTSWADEGTVQTPAQQAFSMAPLAAGGAVRGWHYGAGYLPLLYDQPSDYGLDWGENRSGWLGTPNPSGGSNFFSDPVMQRMGLRAIPGPTPYGWVMGHNTLDRQGLLDLMSRGIVRGTNSGGEAEDVALALDYSSIPTINGMQADDFVRYFPDMTRVRDPRMVMNDPNYGLVTLGANVIQPRDTGIAAAMQMLARYAFSQLMPGGSLMLMAADAAGRRADQQSMQNQFSRFATAMQQRQNGNVQRPSLGNMSRSNPLAQMMLLGRLGSQNRGLLGRNQGMRG